MNATKKLSLAMLLALASSNALALGLGQIKVNSGLNEPLLAVIPVLSDDPAELRGLTAALASPEAFARVGLNFSRLDVPLEFEIVKQADGSTVIQITTDGPVVEPAVGFLLEVNWANGKLLREYSVLLDPPSIAPAVATQRVQPAPAAEATVPRSEPTTAAAPAPTPAPTRPTTTTEPVATQPVATQPVATQPAPAPAAAEPTVTAPSSEPASSTPFANEYTVQGGDTLWGIATAASADAGVNVNRMMVALQQANPDAFFRNNINALKRGAVLRIPGGDELADVRSAAANAEVQRQNQAWADINAAEPTLVARTGGTNDAPSRRASNPGDADHLQLAAPLESGDGGESRAGVDGGTSSAAVAELKQEIARSKEALASEQQRSGELQTRVQALEDLKSKNGTLLSLKNTEIAELQAQLKKAQAEAEAAETAAAAAAISLAQVPAEAATTATLRDDIFNSEAAAASSLAAVAQAGSVAEVATAGSAAIAEAASASVAAASTVAADTAAAIDETAANLAAAASVSTTPAMATTEEAAPAITEPAPQPEPAVVEDQSASTETPWYMQTWAWLLGGAALIAILLGALFSSRRSKSPPSSLADDYDQAHAEGTDHAELTDDEYALLDELEQHPDDLALHLELASFYYALRDQNKFEAAAEAMYSHVDDPAQSEWEQVLAMGEELCPDHPLFAELHTDSDQFDNEGDLESDAVESDADIDTDIDTDEFDADDDATPPIVAAEDGDIRRSSERGYNFDFNLTPPAKTPSGKTPPAPVEEDGAADADLENEFDTEPSLSELAGDGADGTVDDAGFSTDPVDTKLDLARAYHDMGDTEGARAMLDEVIAEGSQMQQDTARKLLQELD